MLLTISTTTTTHAPATDLGFLLHKHPGRFQTFPLSFGQAHVFYPEATAERCTAALLVEVDPVGLIRRGAKGGFALDHYVNDRPYAASSFLSVAIGEVFGSALSGYSRAGSISPTDYISLRTRISAMRCRGGDALARTLFLPLGYTAIDAERTPLDPRFPAWGPSQYWTVELTTVARLQDHLKHLTVLIPVLDDDKHYWVGEDELEKLLRRGEGWLETHPARELIVDRYLKHRRGLVREAISRLTVVEEEASDEEPVEGDREEAEVERRISLHQLRLDAVAETIRRAGARRVLDLGCGEGKLIRRLLEDKDIREIVGVDVSPRVLDHAERRLKLDRAPAKGRVNLLQGALSYRDSRLAGFDAAAVVEVVEHLDPHRLDGFARSLFGHARPGIAIVTTPNREYNVLFEGLPAGRFRHRDHRFEWTRAEFQHWATEVAARFGYAVTFAGIGPEDAVFGAPSQMAVFERQSAPPRATENGVDVRG